MLFSCGPASKGEEYGARMRRMMGIIKPAVTSIRWCTQVHGRLLASLSHEPDQTFSGTACVGTCDGLITAEPGAGLVVWTADCVPVLLAGGGVVAAVHAGWRGAAAGIVPAAVRRFFVEYGIEPSSLTVALGPAVGACHYEVGSEVIASLHAAGVPEKEWREHDRVDLRAFLRAQLVSANVREEAVSLVGGCTACSAECASYRRDGARAGRQWSLVYRTG